MSVGQRTEYNHLKNGNAVCRTYRDGKLVFEVELSKYGSPQSGKMFGEHRKVLKRFTYGHDGQVLSAGGKTVCKR